MPRLLASFFDLILFGAIGTAPEGWGLVQVRAPTVDAAQSWAAGWELWAITVLIASFVLTVPSEAVRGRTFGKLVTGLRAVRPDDRPMGWVRSLRRWGVRWGLPAVLVLLGLGIWGVVLPWAVSVAVGQVDVHGRVLHDLAAGTVVTAASGSALLRGREPIRGVAVLDRTR